MQAAAKGSQVRHSISTILAATKKVSDIETKAQAAETNWEGQGVLRQEHREERMLHGVPVQLIAYEEALLKLQMQLDDIHVGGNSHKTIVTVRQLLRDAVRRIQARLDRIDTCRQWWLTVNTEAQVQPSQADAISVAVA